MINNKGLISFDYVRVIISILAFLLITIPIAVSTVFNARKQLIVANTEAFINAAEKSYTMGLIKGLSIEKTVYTYNDSKETKIGNLIIENNGIVPQYGVIVITPDGKIDMAFYDGVWCTIKENDNNEIELIKINNKDNCLGRIEK